MLFSDVCDLLEDVQCTKGITNKTKIFERGITKFREKTQFNIQQNYDNFYQTLRLIVPKYDHGRKSYNMKENKIAKTIIKMLCIPEGADKRNLLSYHTVNSNVSLDFADIVHGVLSKYISNTQSKVTVQKLNEYLDAIANRDSDMLDDIMLKMFRELATHERKWVVRILLKELKLGIDNNRILNVFHQDAAEYYTTNNNLKKVCEVLWNPSIKLNEFSIQLFEPFQPMLSKRCDAKSFTKDFPENKLFFIENKFDGERFQLHMENNKFKYFSRNGFDYSDKFGTTYASGIMTPKLKGVFHENIKKIILDGEMMLWNNRTKKFGSKGMKFDVKKLNESGYYQPCFCVFDILLLNDDVLPNKQLMQRLKLLRKAVKKTIEGCFIISEYKESDSREKILEELNNTMDNEEEGIVVKDPSSIYKFKDRKSGWHKIKMEYFDDAVTDLDLILMGGFYKTNSRKFNSFLVGVYSNDNSESVFCLGRVASGLNDEEMDLVTKILNEKGSTYDDFTAKTSGKLIFGREVPNVWIEPEHSLILTVRATELIRSYNDAFKTPFTLRFPRILRVRDDKSYKECLSRNELLELCQQNKAVIKLNKRHLSLDEILSVKRQRKIRKIDVDLETLKKTSNCLSDMKFFVLNGAEDFSVDRIEVLIGQHGGTFTLSLEEDVDIVLVGTVTPKVQEYMKIDNKFDIIKLDWLKRVTNSNCLQKYKQDDVINIGLRYYNCLSDDVDMYGDSYTEEIGVESLKYRLQCMAEAKFSLNLNQSVTFKSDLPLFHKYLAYFDKYEVINDPSSKVIYHSFLDEVEFSYRKGTFVDIFDKSVNLIVTETSNEDRIALIEESARNMNCQNFQIIEKCRLYEEDEL